MKYLSLENSTREKLFDATRGVVLFAALVLIISTVGIVFFAAA